MVKFSNVKMPEGEDINSLLDAHEPSVLKSLYEKRGEMKVVNNPPITGQLQKVKGKLDSSNPDYMTYLDPPLKFTMLGGMKMNGPDRMRVTLQIDMHPPVSPLHTIRQTLDLFNDDQVQKTGRKVAARLSLGTTDVQLRFAELTALLAKYRRDWIEARQNGKSKKRELTPGRIKAAKDYLSAPKLLKRTNDDIGKTGIVGERVNRLLVYLCFTSRLRETPLHIVTLGGSGTGKTYVQEKIAELFPDADIVQCTASTDNAFYYIEGGDLRHKIVMIEDLDGAESVLYILRELMSKKMVSKLVPVKDPDGKMTTVRITVYGPICMVATTTRESLYEDNANLSLIISPDTSADQQERIMELQRQASSGKINREKEKELKEFFKDVQSVLKPIAIRNPYASFLRIPPECFKPLRTNAHYLHFVETITFYHQYGREHKTDPVTGTVYIETTVEDIEAANMLIEDVLLRKSDELNSVPCRDFFERLHDWLKEENRQSFFTKEIREQMRLHPSKIKRYLRELQHFGYVKVVGGNRYSGGLEYELGAGETSGELRGKITSVLGGILANIKKNSGSVGH